MCFEPATMAAISLAMQVASAGAQYAAGVEQANAQTERYNQNVVAAQAASRDQYNQTTLRQMQEEQAYVQKQQSTLMEGAERSAEVNASAASAGVGGLSVDALLGDVTRKMSRARATLDQNFGMVAQQLQMQKQGITAQEQSRINSMSPGTPPSGVELGFRVATAGVNYGREMNRINGT